MADTHDTRLRRLQWERRRAGAYRAQVAFERGTVTYALEREGRSAWVLLAHGPVGTRVIATDLRTMREGRDLAQRVTDLRARREAQERAQRVTDLRARRETQALARWREALRSEAKWREALRREAQWHDPQAWMSSECSCGSDTQERAQRRSRAQAQATEWSNGARLTWRPFSELALMLAQARVAQ